MSDNNTTTDLQPSEAIGGVQVWNNDKADKIRQIFAPNLNNDEFAFFWGLGKSLGANPFAREIWAVKYDKNEPAQVFLGRDFYRKKAQEQPDYNGHIVDAVYSNDEFRVESGVPRHSYTLSDRGELKGAYCTVYKKGIDNHFYVYVELDEYHKGQSTWNEKPATMIKKVAEAQGLRGAYQGLFRATYDESEQWSDSEGLEVHQPEEREAIDVDMNTGEVKEGNTGEPVEEAKELVEESDNSEFDEMLSEVNTLGKQIFGGIQNWVKESKAMIANLDESAEGLHDLDIDDLEHIKRQLEAKSQKVEA